MTTTIFNNKSDNRSLAPFGGFSKNAVRVLALVLAMAVAGILLLTVVRATRVGAR